MGSDPIALPALNAIADGRCGAIDLEAIYTQPDKPRGRGKRIEANAIKLWALEKKLPVFQPEKTSKSVRLEIEAIDADAILVMAYGHILSQALIDTPACGIWNLHTSLLPRYRGASPIQSAIASGDSESGVSLMKVVRAMDAGPILDVERVRINKLDTSIDLEEKLSQACVPLLERNMESVFSGEAHPAPQDDAAATHVRKLVKADGVLDFRRSAVELANRVNGLFPWPGTRFENGDDVIKVGLADAWEESGTRGADGEVLGLEDGGLAIACGEGVLLLKRLQRTGGKMLDAAEFLRGYEIANGVVLESKEMPPLVS